MQSDVWRRQPARQPASPPFFFAMAPAPSPLPAPSKLSLFHSYSIPAGFPQASCRRMASRGIRRLCTQRPHPFPHPIHACLPACRRQCPSRGPLLGWPGLSWPTHTHPGSGPLITHPSHISTSLAQKLMHKCLPCHYSLFTTFCMPRCGHPRYILPSSFCLSFSKPRPRPGLARASNTTHAPCAAVLDAQGCA